MAFEDRCSPNQATTPGPDPRQSSPKSPDPSDRNPKPYTCSTMTTKYERSKSPQLRTNQNINTSQYKQELIQVNPMINPFHASPIMYNPYYNPYIINTLPIHPDYIIQLQLQQQNLNAPKLLIDNHQRQNNNIVHDAVANRRNHNEVMIVNTEENDLHFSISNILKPEFGSSAIRKTTHKIEGPKHGGPTHSILYKPYEIAKGLEDSEHVERNTEDSPFKTAPLGSLCNTVSQIGTKNFATKALKAQENLVKSNSGFSSSFGASKDDLSSLRRPDSANSSISTSSSNVSSQQGLAGGSDDAKSGDAANPQWPAWVYCTRYSDRPSSGPRSRRAKKPKQPAPAAVVAPVASVSEDKRPRTAFSSSQLQRLKHEFAENRYLNERRRQQLSGELGLNEAQIKIWFQNKRAKIKKASGQKNPLALQLMAQGLYNHGTASCSEGEEDEMTDIQVA